MSDNSSKTHKWSGEGQRQGSSNQLRYGHLDVLTGAWTVIIMTPGVPGVPLTLPVIMLKIQQRRLQPRPPRRRSRFDSWKTQWPFQPQSYQRAIITTALSTTTHHRSLSGEVHTFYLRVCVCVCVCVCVGRWMPFVAQAIMQPELN